MDTPATPDSAQRIPAMDPWLELRRFTSARIALGRTGGSLPTREKLDFRLAHARARDAVLASFDSDALTARFSTFDHPVLTLESAAADRAEYLQRPDLGRRLSSRSRSLVVETAARLPAPDLAIIVSDGLSTHALNTQSAPLLEALLPLLFSAGWSLSPILVVRNARVALQDEAGELLRARMSLILLGERPGLGCADSLGAYFTFAPAMGKTDADRNCVSNIRQGGLPPVAAAKKLHFLLTQSAHLGLSGVGLKDDSPGLADQAQTLGHG